MQQNKIYGELVNNKFSELLTSDREENWKAMKELLYKELPDRRRKWLIWFRSKTRFW
jgi:hypothetical protein